jgi:hypothetical protein
MPAHVNKFTLAQAHRCVSVCRMPGDSPRDVDRRLSGQFLLPIVIVPPTLGSYCLGIGTRSFPPTVRYSFEISVICRPPARSVNELISRSTRFKITDANHSLTQRIYLRDSSRFGIIDFGMSAGSTSSHSTSNVPTKPNSGPQNWFLTSHSILYLPIASSNQT